MKLPERPPPSPRHTEERLKLGANGLQALSLTLLAVVLIGPALNAALSAPLWARIIAGVLAGSAELSAFLLLRYIPTSDTGAAP